MTQNGKKVPVRGMIPRLPAPGQGRVSLPGFTSTGCFDRTGALPQTFYRSKLTGLPGRWQLFIHKPPQTGRRDAMVITILVLYALAAIIWRATRGPPLVKDFKEGEINE